MSDDLRNACEEWCRSRIEVQDCPFDEDVASLLAFVQQQLAVVWEKAAKIDKETSSWRETYADELGHRERLSECELICNALRTQAAKERKP